MIPFLHIKTLRNAFLLPFATWLSTWVIYILKNATFKNFINSIFLQKDCVFPLCSVNKKLPRVFALFVVFCAPATYSNTDCHLNTDEMLTVNDNSVLFISKDAVFSTGKDVVVYSKIQHNNETNVNSGAFGVFIVGDAFIYDDQNLLFVSKQNILQQAVPEKASVMPRDIDLQIVKLKERLPKPEVKPTPTFKNLNSDSNTAFVTSKQPTTSPVPASYQLFFTTAQVALTLQLQIFKEETLAALQSLDFYFQSSHSYFFSRPPPFI